MATSWSTTREGLLQALLGADRQLDHLQGREKILVPAAGRISNERRDQQH